MKLESLAGQGQMSQKLEKHSYAVSDKCVFAMLLTLLKKNILHSRCVQITTRSGASLGTFDVCKEWITDMPVGKLVLYISGQKWLQSHVASSQSTLTLHLFYLRADSWKELFPIWSWSVAWDPVRQCSLSAIAYCNHMLILCNSLDYSLSSDQQKGFLTSVFIFIA